MGTTLKVEKSKTLTLIVAGIEDTISSFQWAKRRVPDARTEALKGLGHWHCFEDVDGVARTVEILL